MVSVLIDPAVDMALRGAAAALFATAAWHKLKDPIVFWQVLAAYRLIPERLARPASILLPLVESATALGLVFLPSSPAPVIAALALWLAYGIAMAINLVRGRTQLECGCGGLAADQTIGWTLVGRNVLLAGFVSLLLLPAGTRAFLWVDGVTALFGALILMLLYASCDHLMRNAVLLSTDEAS